MSLASYRDCLGSKCRGEASCSYRGSFDRGDLKEVAGAAVRAMEPEAVFGQLRYSDFGDVTAAGTSEDWLGSDGISAEASAGAVSVQRRARLDRT